MKIYIANNKMENKFLGRTEDGYTIPRIGEGVYIGYEPAPLVEQIVYIYKRDTVVVKLDTPFPIVLE